MKQVIFNRGRGWYISCTNYKDKNDKAYLSLFFPKGSAPEYADNGMGYSVKRIDILEAKFTSYGKQPQMTIFKYVEVPMDRKEDSSQNNSNMGGSRQHLGEEIDVYTDDLEFY